MLNVCSICVRGSVTEKANSVTDNKVDQLIQIRTYSLRQRYRVRSVLRARPLTSYTNAQMQEEYIYRCARSYAR